MIRRKEVELFADAMERKLQANEHKGGWKHDSAMSLLPRLRQEVQELTRAVGEGTDEDILSEAADVANFAMMVADVCGELK